MKNYVIASLTGIVVMAVADLGEHAQHAAAVLELGDGDSTLALRYKLVDGKIVDQFPGETDKKVLAAVEATRDAEHAESVTNFKLASNDFLRFLGSQRRMAVRALAKAGDSAAEDMLDMFNRATFIDSQNADLKFALSYLQAKGGEGFARINEEFYTTGHTFAS